MLNFNPHSTVSIAELHQFVMSDIQQRYRHCTIAPAHKQRRYCNQIALNLAIDWFGDALQLETQQWEKTNGTALEFMTRQQRLVVLPQESADTTFLIPDLWMLHRHLKADYFLFIQINSDKHWAKYLGWAEAHQIQSHLTDVGSQTFSLEPAQLVTELSRLIYS